MPSKQWGDPTLGGGGGGDDPGAIIFLLVFVAVIGALVLFGVLHL